MRKDSRKIGSIALGMSVAFVLWTVCLRLVDVQTIGPRGSAVGLATLNRAFHNLTGVNMLLYIVTDWLGLVPVAVGFGFAVLGLIQWVQRKHIRKVDADVLVLGVFYLVVMGVYFFFETVVVNYRPILINGFLEASYPSSTTMLVLCVLPTAIMLLNSRIKNKAFKRGVAWAITAFIAFMVVARLVSGVHWLTDIIGGGVLSAGLVMAYRFVCVLCFKNSNDSAVG